MAPAQYQFQYDYQFQTMILLNRTANDVWACFYAQHKTLLV